MPDFGDNVNPDGRYSYSDPALDPTRMTDPAQIAAYRSKRKRDAILGILATLGATTGLGALGGALAGGGATAAAGALPAIEGGAPWAVTPFAGSASMVPTGAAAVGGSVGAGALAGAGGEVANHVMDGGDSGGVGDGGGLGGMFGDMSGKDIAALVAALGGTIGGALSDRPNNTPSAATMDPAIKNLIEMQTKRMNQQQPLYDSALSMANGLLPTEYQNGGRGRG